MVFTMENKIDSTKATKPLTVSEQLLNEIRNQIAIGTFKTNSQLPTELELAKQFNVSRASVREAIKTLSYLGIVESCTSRGTRITNKNHLFEKAASWSVVLGCEDFRDAFVLGTALDTQVSIIAAEKLNHDKNLYRSFTEEIVRILSEMALVAIQKDRDAFRARFSDFFRTFYGFSGNTIFISLDECIESLIADRVCDAFFATDTMLEAVKYYNSAWNAILNYDWITAIDIFQNYGAFAYDTVTKYEEQLDKSTLIGDVGAAALRTASKLHTN